jgi:hypothetical protein
MEWIQDCVKGRYRIEADSIEAYIETASSAEKEAAAKAGFDKWARKEHGLEVHWVEGAPV